MALAWRPMGVGGDAPGHAARTGAGCSRGARRARTAVRPPGAPAAPGTAPDDQGDPSFLPEAWAGLDGLSKPGRWLTVRAVVANDGPPLDGQIRLTTRAGNDAAIYTQRIELATRSRKLVTFQLPGPTGAGELRLTLRVRRPGPLDAPASAADARPERLPGRRDDRRRRRAVRPRVRQAGRQPGRHRPARLPPTCPPSRSASRRWMRW